MEPEELGSHGPEVRRLGVDAGAVHVGVRGAQHAAEGHDQAQLLGQLLVQVHERNHVLLQPLQEPLLVAPLADPGLLDYFQDAK